MCSILLGTSTLLVWVGVIRYLSFFQKYNVGERHTHTNHVYLCGAFSSLVQIYSGFSLPLSSPNRS